MNEQTQTTEHEIEWRQRAIRAEQEGEQLKARVDELQGQLQQREAEGAQRDQRLELERMLAQAGAVDVETAAMLAQQRLADEGASVAAVVADLKKEKGFLFGRPLAAPVMTAAGEPGSGDVLTDAAERARESGHRNEVLRYLRLRRQGV